MKNKLFLHKEIYTERNIKRAIKAYEELATIKIEQEEQYFICEIIDSRYDLQRTVWEFENYIIALSNRIGEKV